MITVSSAYKTAVKADAKQIKAYIDDGTTKLTESDDLKSIIIKQESQLLHTVMRRADIIHLGTTNYLDKDVNFGVGVVLADTTTEYIDYGTFKVIEREVDKATGDVKLKAFDKMNEALIDWALEPIYDITYPTTLKGLLEAICTKLGWTLGTATFPNDYTAISTDLFTGVIKTYRDALEYIAEASASIIYFDIDDTLKVRQVAHTGSLETLDSSVLETMKVESVFGGINSVVLARTPQEDNIVQKDDGDIAVNGLTEMKIANNFIVDSARETWITEIYNELLGLSYYPFSASTFGLGYLQIGDRITLQDPASNSFVVVVMKITTSITGGFKESYSADRPDKSNTNYNRAGIIGQTIRNTEIKVDKQNGEIDALVSTTDGLTTSVGLNANSITLITARVGTAEDNIDALEEDVVSLTQTADDLTIAVSGMGGSNLLLNSVGLKGSLTEWQVYDEDGDLVNANNDGAIIQTSDVAENSESGSALQMTDEQFLEQTFNTIVGEDYTLYFRYKRTADAWVYLSAVGSNIALTETVDEWAIFKYAFEAQEATTTLRFIVDASETLTVSDCVVKLGDCTGWVQAPNEVYGSNFRFDKEGFSITSLTDTFKSLLDNTKLAVYDTAGGSDKIMMVVSKDSGKITQLIAQEQLTVQNYEDSSNALRIMPTATGAMITIND